MMRIPVVLALAACGSPTVRQTVPPPVPVVAITAPAPGMKLHYVACSDRGHASITFVAGKLPGAPWSVSDATDRDLANDPTVEGRLRLERPALVARSGDATIVTTGMSRAELDRLIANLATTGGDPQRHHVVDQAHLHLPWPSVFDGVSAQLGKEIYVARLGYSSVFGGMAGVAPTPIRGLDFRWSAGLQAIDDHAGVPTIKAWHGEVFQHDAVIALDAAGDGVTDRSFLAFSEQALRAASAGPPSSCRVRTGGPPYQLSTSDTPLVAGEIRFEDAGARRTIRFEDDGSVREGRIPIGSISTNGLLTRYDRGVPRIVGQLDRRTGEILVDDKPVATAGLPAGTQYLGPANGRLTASLASWIARH